MHHVLHIRAVLEVDEGVRRRKVDPETLHEQEECHITLWLLNKLFEGIMNDNRVSEALARDALTGMSVDVDKIKEARAKEMHAAAQFQAELAEASSQKAELIAERDGLLANLLCVSEVRLG